MSGNDTFGKFMNRRNQMQGPDTQNISDLLPTHPKSKGNNPNAGMFENAEVRVKMFDLSNPAERQKYEEITTKIMHREAVLRFEKINADKEGFVIITLSWLEFPDDEVSPETSDGTDENQENADNDDDVIGAGIEESKMMDQFIEGNGSEPEAGVSEEKFRELIRSKRKEAADNAENRQERQTQQDKSAEDEPSEDNQQSDEPET